MGRPRATIAHIIRYNKLLFFYIYSHMAVYAHSPPLFKGRSSFIKGYGGANSDFVRPKL